MTRIAETAKADELRAACVQKMCENTDFDVSIVNADMPPHIRYESVEARIREMAKTDHLPGELEIIALSKVLGRSISVLKPDFSVLRKYDAPHTGSATSPLYVTFTVLGQDVGHYECALPLYSHMTTTSSPGISLSSSSTTDGSPIIGTPTSDTTSPLSRVYSVFSKCNRDVFKNRIGRMSKPTILTSSPYKKKLEVAEEKRQKLTEKKNKAAEKRTLSQRKAEAKQSTNKVKERLLKQNDGHGMKAAQCKTRKVQSTKMHKSSCSKSCPPVQNPAWYCFMCAESTVEDMIKCQGPCGRWVHCSCAGCGSAHFYFCDLCFSGN